MQALWLRRHRNSILFLLALLILGGCFSIYKMPVALFPSIEFPRIVVTVDSGDRPVGRMINEVTRPLEFALRGVPDVLGIRSSSDRGSAELSLNFNWGSNMDLKLLQVQSAINQVLTSLPAGTTFSAQRMSPNVFPVFGLALTSATRNLVDITSFAQFQLLPLLSTVPGVAQVQLLGGQHPEFQILIDPLKLREIGLTLDDVRQALAANTTTTAVGKIEDYYRLYLILTDTHLTQAQDIANTILRSGKNGIVELGEIAEIIKGTTPQWTKVTANGHDAVLMNIMQQPNANTVNLVQSINSQLAEFKNQIPSDIQIKTYYDQSQLIINSAHSVRDAIVIGAILAGLVLLFFLRNLRMTIIIAAILPCVLATTSLILFLFNMSFNIMTLGGMAAAVGLIIDDCVVMLEHLMRRISESNQEGEGIITIASFQMLRPLAGSSLATIIIFLPLAFITGVTGSFFKSLALTMGSALIISFIFAFFVVPLLGELFIHRKSAQKIEVPNSFLVLVLNLYHKTGAALIDHSRWLLSIIGMVIIIGALAYTQVPSGFMPHMDEGGFILDYSTPPGTSLTETDRLLHQVEKIIVSLPEVDSYSRRTGLQLGGGLTEANSGDFFIHLTSHRRNIENVMSDLRRKINTHVPSLKIETAQLMEDMIGDLTAVPQPIEIKIFGDNQLQLQNMAELIAKKLQSIRGIVEIKNGIVISGDTININIDRVKAALYNLDASMITQQIQTQLMGSIIGGIQSDQRLVNIRIWTSPKLRNRLQQLHELLLRSTNGHYVALDEVATIDIHPGDTEIVRENLQSMLAVTARIEGRDMGSAMKDVKNKIGNLTLPRGLYIKYGGLYAEQQKSFLDLLLVFFSALLLVTMLLLFLYENLTIVFSILSTIFLALSGTFLGLWLTGTELNISAMMGLTMIIGIVAEIAIFYFAEFITYSRGGKNELIQAGQMRMRPILMTSIIAILALLPLALGIGAGSAMQTPLAIAIISGLVWAVPLVLLIMPGIYLLLNNQMLRFRSALQRPNQK